MIRAATIALAVSLVCLAGPARAASLVSSPLWTDVSNAAACYIRNTGTTPVKVQVSLFSNNGFHIDVDTCNGPTALAAGRTCVMFTLDLPDDSDVSCSVTAGNVSKLRGNIDIRHFVTGGAVVVVGDDLR